MNTLENTNKGFIENETITTRKFADGSFENITVLKLTPATYSEYLQSINIK